VAPITPDFKARVAHIERILKSSGLRARVGFRSAVPSAVAGVVQATDMIYGSSPCLDSRDLEGLRVVDVKIGDHYLNYPVTAYIHRKNEKSPLITWLLGLIAAQLEN
jgi:DNA-binding transcriptional LysR family regulator